MYETFVYCGTCAECVLTQPANQLGNLAFVYAAWLFWRRKEYRWLAGAPVLVFTASSIWHQWPGNLTLAVDVLAASLLGALLARASLLKHHGLSPTGALAGTGGLLVVSAGAAAVWDPLPLHGVMVVPGVLYLLFSGMRTGNLRLLAAGGCLGAGLALRSVDMLLCPYIPFGTHVFWHMLAAMAAVLAAWSLHKPYALPKNT